MEWTLKRPYLTPTREHFFIISIYFSILIYYLQYFLSLRINYHPFHSSHYFFFPSYSRHIPFSLRSLHFLPLLHFLPPFFFSSCSFHVTPTTQLFVFSRPPFTSYPLPLFFPHSSLHPISVPSFLLGSFIILFTALLPSSSVSSSPFSSLPYLSCIFFLLSQLLIFSMLFALPDKLTASSTEICIADKVPRFSDIKIY